MGGGEPGAPPPKIGKNMIFWRIIVIFHTKYPKYFHAFLRSAQYFYVGVAWNKDYRCKYSVNTQKTTLSVSKSVYLSFRATNVISKIIYNEDSIIFCKC